MYRAVVLTAGVCIGALLLATLVCTLVFGVACAGVALAVVTREGVAEVQSGISRLLDRVQDTSTVSDLDRQEAS